MDLLHRSKNLYNVAIYTVRQFYFDAVKNERDKKYLNFYATWELLSHSNNVDYYALPCVISQQVLM